MSKFVAIIDDENYTCPLEHEGYCHIARNKIYNCMEDCDGILNARPEFCPLKEYKEVIPVEYIKNKIAVNMHLWEEGKDKMFIENGVVEVVSYSLTAQTLSKLLELWEKENEGVSE